MGPTDASIVANQPELSFVQTLPIGHHVPGGRPEPVQGEVFIGGNQPNVKPPSQVTREPGDYVPELPPRDAPPALEGEVSLGANEPGVLSPSQRTRGTRS